MGENKCFKQLKMFLLFIYYTYELCHFKWKPLYHSSFILLSGVTIVVVYVLRCWMTFWNTKKKLFAVFRSELCTSKIHPISVNISIGKPFRQKTLYLPRFFLCILTIVRNDYFIFILFCKKLANLFRITYGIRNN